MKYLTKGDTIIYDPSFNDELDNKLLNNYEKIIFCNYYLNNNLFEKYENDDLEDLEYIYSKFNQSVDNLPSTITHLT